MGLNLKRQTTVQLESMQLQRNRRPAVNRSTLMLMSIKSADAFVGFRRQRQIIRQCLTLAMALMTDGFFFIQSG
jgi:hypothetical protein